jgi:hypothetical protein
MYLHLWDLNRKAPGDSTRTTGQLTRQQLRQFNDLMNVLGVVSPRWHQGCIGTWSPGMKDEPHMGVSVTQNPQWKNLLEHESVQHRRLLDAYDQTTDLFSPAIERELHLALRAESSGWDLSEELHKMGDWGVHASRQLQVRCCCLLFVCCLFVVCLLLYFVVVNALGHRCTLLLMHFGVDALVVDALRRRCTSSSMHFVVDALCRRCHFVVDATLSSMPLRCRCHFVVDATSSSMHFVVDALRRRCTSLHFVIDALRC